MCFEVSQQTSKSSTSMGSWTESEGIKFETAKVPANGGRWRFGDNQRISKISKDIGISWHDSLQEALAVCIFCVWIFSLPFLRCVPLFCFMFFWFSFRPHVFLHHPSYLGYQQDGLHKTYKPRACKERIWGSGNLHRSVLRKSKGHTGNLKDTSVLKHLDTTLDASVNSELHQRVRDINKTINKWLVYVHHVLKHWQGQWLYDIVRNLLIVYVVYINSYIHGCSMYTYLHIHALLVFTKYIYIETCFVLCFAATIYLLFSVFAK